ncbi:MAG: beta-ketoacyl synthase N-terminal-like domain-containing protein [Myxococcota bacterium]
MPPLEASHVVGTLPNMPANRLSSQLDLKGPSFTVAAETESGTDALSIAMRALRAGELEFALVGAVDLSHEVVHRAATSGANAADAAVVLTLCTEEVARERGLPVLATLEPASFTPSATVRDRIGSAHAAETLLEVTAGILSCARGQRIGGAPWTDTTRHQNVAGVSIEATAISPRATAPEVGATLTFPARRPAVSVPPVSIPPLSRATQGTASMQTMPPAPWLPPVGEAAPTSAPSARTSAQPQPIAGAVSATAMAHAAPPSTTTTTVTSAATPPATIAATARSTPALPPSAPPDALPPSTAPGALPPSTAPGALPPSTAPIAEPQPGVPSFLAHFTAHQRRLGEIHRAFLEQQSALHQQFLQTTLFVPTANVPAGTQPATALPSAAQASVPMPLPMPVPKSAALPTAVPAASPTVPLPRSAPPTAPASQGIAPPTASKAAPPVPVSVPEDANAHAHPPRATPTPQPNGAATELPLAFKPRGPSFDRDALKVHASGKISTIFGPLFEQQDGYAVQVRMPEPPLLLADRCTGMDAEPGSMGKGTCWTETDVRADSWYLQHDGHMPAGIMIESGQADLMLISYLGADFANKGERSYRLLGCEMTWLGDLPKVGETLAYDIHIDGHAQQGDVRLFFFHYDCWVRRADGTYRPALRVRHGQAGFFTDEELADSAGILWKPEEQDIIADARVDPPAVDHGKRAFTGEELRAFADGEPWRCFGEGVMRTKTHTRTPQIQSGRMLFLDEVTEFDPKGGPWGRGYLKGVAEITPDKWFFDGHFKNDPCMPGTLMLEGCVQTMAFYLSALGYTVDKDGWRFQPIIDETYKLICRGQVTPTSKHLTYEVFVEEVHDGPEPMLYADLLCTVDGLGAFHARRFGLKLVPGWPLSSPEKALPATETDERAALGIYEGTSHRFDYASLLACAWGQPSTAFGPMYARFDGTRRTPRLPGPPYHFLTRVTQVGGAMGELETGCDFEFEYEVPEDVWYFGENGAKVMPFAVLLEAALQPCGWIASYVGSTLTSEDDFLFRNLDGTGTIHAEVVPSSGTLRTEVRNKNLSRSAGMIIVSFDVRCFVGDTLVYELDTVFGFFPPSAFDNQQGLPATDEQRALLAIDSDYSVDLRARPAKYCSGSARLAEPFLLMLDRITHWDATGGRDGLGCLRGEKDVDPGEWFFKAHFYQDPVQPGSLGIEAMLQALQFHMLEAGMDEGMEAPRFEAIATGMEHVWKYRGQVVPENKLISTTLEIVEVGEDARGRFVRGDCSLWVDGKRIYEAPGLGMRLVDGAPEGTSPGASDSTATSNGAAKGASNGMSAATATKASASSSTATVAATTGAATSSAATSGAITAGADGTLTLTPAAQPWLLDHCPTHTLPALPMMSIVDLMLGAARAELGEIHALSNVRMERWVVIDQSARLRTEVEGREVRVLVWRDAANPKLSRFEVAARARIETPSFEPLRDAVTSPVADPYATDALFHGPAFHYLVSLERGTDASRGVLDAAKGTVPYGAAHQGLLDAVTHILPHDQLSLWSDQVGDDVVAYPHHLDLQLYEALPTEGQVECEARFEGFEDAEKRFPIFRMQLRKEGRALADFRLVEVLMPKGRLGVLPPSDRRRFLRDALPIPGATLSAVHDAGATLDASDVRLCDWLPGTVRQAYGLTTRELSEIAIKDHLSQRVGLHPQQIEVTGDRAIAASLPLTSFQYETAGNREAVAVRLTGEALTIDRVRAFWREFFGLGSWPVEDLYYALLRQFVGRFHVDPGLQALQGRGVLYLGNHQVGIESLLFSIVTGALQRVPTLTLAKDEHRQSWLGQLIALCFRYPGAKDPGVITHFDRSDPASLPRIAKNLAGEAGAKSLMVHVEGTRAHSAGHRVSTMSGIFCDLAIQANVPIVPVRFTRGLPSEPAADKLEYPVGMGRQDYHLGAPIFPEALKGLPYKERTESVVAAINALGPAEDTPSAPNGELATRVATWMEQSGVSVGLATILEVLRDAPDASESVRRLARGASSRELAVGPSPEEQWLGELATLLYGR